MVCGGGPSVVNLLYMAAMVTCRHNNKIIREVYSRLRNSGKTGKVALMACIRKLIVILNAMLKKKQPFCELNS